MHEAIARKAKLSGTTINTRVFNTKGQYERGRRPIRLTGLTTGAVGE